MEHEAAATTKITADNDYHEGASDVENMEDIFVAGEELIFLLDNEPGRDMEDAADCFNAIEVSSHCKNEFEIDAYSDKEGYDDYGKDEYGLHVQDEFDDHVENEYVDDDYDDDDCYEDEYEEVDYW